MPELSAADAVTQENQRVMGILGCPEAVGHEALAQMLAGQPGMSVAQAKSILAAAAPADTTSTADRILAPKKLVVGKHSHRHWRPCRR